MPTVNGKVITPEAAIAKGLCPEYGVDLSELDIEARIATLWPRDRSEEAVHRIDLLRQYDEKRKLDAAAAAASPKTE